MVDIKNTKTNKKSEEPYFPDPFEAQMLKELKLQWRYYSSKKEFDKVVAENKEQIITVDKKQTTKWDAARHQAFLDIVGPDSEKEDTSEIDNWENELRNNPKFYHYLDRLQMAHLYNRAGFKPEITKPYKEERGGNILIKVKHLISDMEHGKMINGKYVPSPAEKEMQRALRDYGCFVRYPKNETKITEYWEDIENAFDDIADRNDYQNPTKKERKKETLRIKKARQERNKTMADTEEIEFTTEEEEGFKKWNIDKTKIKSHEAANAAIEQAKQQETAEIEKPKENTEEHKTPKDSTDENKEEKKPLGIEIGQTQPAEKTNEQEPEWITRKAQWYQKMADEKQISGYERDTSKQGFAAKFENAEIHYSSPDHVTVSEDAGFKVFDTMLKEEDNKGRPIEFPENASKEIATRLYAACVLNGNPMQGAIPAEIDMDELAKCGLTPEQLKQVTDYYNNASKGQEQSEEKIKDNTEQKTEEKNQEELSDKDKQNIEILNLARQLGIVNKDASIASEKNPEIKLQPDKEITPLEGEEKEKRIKELSPQQIEALLKENITQISDPNEQETLSKLRSLDAKYAEKEFSKTRAELNQIEKSGKIGLEEDNKGNTRVTAKDGCSAEELAKAQDLARNVDDKRRILAIKELAHSNSEPNPTKEQLKKKEALEDDVYKEDTKYLVRLSKDLEKWKKEGKIIVSFDDKGNHIVTPKECSREELLIATRVAQDMDKISNSLTVRENIKNYLETRKNFEQMKAERKITIQENPDKTLKIIKGSNGKDNDVQEANNLMKIAAELRQKIGPEANTFLRKKQMEAMRIQMSDEQIKAHNDQKEKRDLIMAARLGIAPKGTYKDHKGREVTAKTGAELKKYEDMLNKANPETIKRLKEKYQGR